MAVRGSSTRRLVPAPGAVKDDPAAECLHAVLQVPGHCSRPGWRRRRGQAAARVAGHGRIVAEFFDVGYSRTLAWARRPQAAALVAALADPDRGWDAVVIGEYAGLLRQPVRLDGTVFEHYGIQLTLSAYARRPSRIKQTLASQDHPPRWPRGQVSYGNLMSVQTERGVSLVRPTWATRSRPAVPRPVRARVSPFRPGDSQVLIRPPRRR